MADKTKGEEPEGKKQLEDATKKEAAKGGSNDRVKKGGASSHGVGKKGGGNKSA